MAIASPGRVRARTALEETAQAGRLAVRHLDEHGPHVPAIDAEDPQVERLERRGGDGHGHDDPAARGGSRRDRRHVAVDDQRRLGHLLHLLRVTPGATSISFSPSRVTSSTQ